MQNDIVKTGGISVFFICKLSSPEIALHKKRRYAGKSNELCEVHAERL